MGWSTPLRTIRSSPLPRRDPADSRYPPSDAHPRSVCSLDGQFEGSGKRTRRRYQRDGQDSREGSEEREGESRGARQGSVGRGSKQEVQLWNIDNTAVSPLFSQLHGDAAPGARTPGHHLHHYSFRGIGGISTSTRRSTGARGIIPTVGKGGTTGKDGQKMEKAKPKARTSKEMARTRANKGIKGTRKKSQRSEENSRQGAGRLRD